jgi:hypothetical protein
MFPDAPFTPKARSGLGQNLSAPNWAVETSYFRPGGRASLERPYGLASLLQLAAELCEWNSGDCHDFRSFVPLGRPDGKAPFFAGAKLPSMKPSSNFNCPASFKLWARIRAAFSLQAGLTFDIYSARCNLGQPQ